MTKKKDLRVLTHHKFNVSHQGNIAAGKQTNPNLILPALGEVQRPHVALCCSANTEELGDNHRSLVSRGTLTNQTAYLEIIWSGPHKPER